jgi:hypothetical protein
MILFSCRSFSDLNNGENQEQSLPTATKFGFPATWTPLPSTATPSLTPLPPTLTPLPAIPTEQVLNYVKGLLENNNGCNLPCFWGITPGETSRQTAKQFLYTFTNSVTTKIPPPLDVDYVKDLSPQFEVLDGTVHGITTYNYKFSGIDAWYYLHNILITYGVPEHVSIYVDQEQYTGSRPTGIIVFYGDLGFMIKYVSFFKIEEVDEFIEICPDGTYNYMYIWPPELDLSFNVALDKYVDNVQNGIPHPRPLQAVTDLEIQDFYDAFKDSATQSCIRTPSEFWPPYNNDE